MVNGTRTSWKLHMWFHNSQEMLRVLTIVMTCFILASIWKFQYFWTPVYNPAKHLWCSFYGENSKQLSILKKSSIIYACLGSKYDTAFTWGLFKRFISLKYFALKDSWNLLFLVKYFTYFNSSKVLLNIEVLNHLTY